MRRSQTELHTLCCTLISPALSLSCSPMAAVTMTRRIAVLARRGREIRLLAPLTSTTPSPSRPWLSLLALSLLLYSAAATRTDHTGLIRSGGDPGGDPGHTVPMQGHSVPLQKRRELLRRELAAAQEQTQAPEEGHLNPEHRTVMRRELAAPYLFPAAQISTVCNSTGPVLLGVRAGNAKTTRWKGWGTSLGWLGNYIGGLPSKELKVFLDLLFSKKAGLGLNIVRYNIWGGFNATYSPQFTTTGGRRFWAAPGFRQDPSKGYNWSADHNQRSVLLGARARGANTFMAYSNSAPWWMTFSGDVAGNWNGKSNLKPEYFRAFAEYLADVVHQYATNPDWKITFRYLEPFNEPEGRRAKGNNQEGCPYVQDEVSRLIPLVHQALRDRGMLSTQVVATDGLPDALANYTLSLPGPVLRLVPVLAVHPYETRRWSSPLDKTAQQYINLGNTVKHLKKDLFATEWGPNQGEGSDLGVSLYMARIIVESINLMGVSAFVYWQAIDIVPAWTLINVQWGAPSAFPISFSKKYSVLKQFSRLVRPGSVNIPLDAPDGCQLNTVAFYDPCRNRLALFVVNQDSLTRSVSFKLSGFTTAWKNVAVTSTVYRTSGTEDFHWYTGPGVDFNKVVSVTAYGRSLVTLQITNVMPTTGGARCAH